MSWFVLRAGQYLKIFRCSANAHYKTVMKYKTLSRKFRQAAGVSDPVPASELLPDGESRAVEERNARGEMPKVADTTAKAGSSGDASCREFSSD